MDNFANVHGKPRPSTSTEVLEVYRLVPPRAASYVRDVASQTEDPFALEPQATLWDPPADSAKQRSVPGGWELKKPRRKRQPFQYQGLPGASSSLICRPPQRPFSGPPNILKTVSRQVSSLPTDFLAPHLLNRNNTVKNG